VLVWYKDVYRHPSRQGEHPEEEYVMKHDIYSLGVCLLEIGIWTSLIEWNKNGKVASLRPGFGLTDQLQDDSTKKEALQLKRVLQELASENNRAKVDPPTRKCSRTGGSGPSH
jgi:hypothetical protein